MSKIVLSIDLYLYVYFVPLNKLENKFQIPINAFLNLRMQMPAWLISTAEMKFIKRSYSGQAKKKIKTPLILQ